MELLFRRYGNLMKQYLFDGLQTSNNNSFKIFRMTFLAANKNIFDCMEKSKQQQRKTTFQDDNNYPNVLSLNVYRKLDFCVSQAKQTIFLFLSPIVFTLLQKTLTYPVITSLLWH